MAKEVPTIPKSSLSRLIERRNLLSNQNYLVEGLFEKGEIHFISGPSGVGKTSWFFKFIKEWSERKLIFGRYKSYPTPYAYIVCDRSFLLTAMTLERLGLSDWDIPIFTIDELQRELGKQELTLGDVADMLPWAETLCIDAIGWFDPVKSGKQMSYTQALHYWSDIRNRVTSKGKSILATTHSPKAKGKERYGNPRDRVMGTVGTMGSIATVINLEFGEEENVADNHRIINISARNSPGMVFKYSLDDRGSFVYEDVFEGETKENEKGFYILSKTLAKYQKHDVLTSDFLKELQTTLNLSRATLYRCLHQLETQGFIRKLVKGQYLVTNKIDLGGIQ